MDRATQLSHQIDKIFSSCFRNVKVDLSKKEIYVYWIRSPEGRLWHPYSGGPIYNDSAKQHVKWLKGHLEEFRELLPKAVRQFKIVACELQASNGKLYPVTDAEMVGIS